MGDKNYRGKGFGQESFRLLLDFAFNELNLHKVYLRVFSFNEGEIRLYLKLGFYEEGELIEQFYREGSWHNVIFMDLFKRDYKKAWRS
ncbi:GNAT family N-acetyltransferase [Virgibacillus salinus]|uniref:GNAT family N-acetyltransferase n=1 Tax=Virgibacillus salinus TaxID=553311 RepID=UPI00267677C0|nr:GNAT family protein [Virgibacillus salinus]